MSEIINNKFYEDIRIILETSRKDVSKAINFTMVYAYWNIGKRIIDEQKGNETSVYGSNLLGELSKKLSIEYGKGFDETNLSRMRKFFLAFSNRDTLCHDLSWSHYRLLLKLENVDAINFYVEESKKTNY